MTKDGYLTQKEPQELKLVRRTFSNRSPSVSQQDAFTERRKAIEFGLIVNSKKLIASIMVYELCSYCHVVMYGCTLVRIITVERQWVIAVQNGAIL